MSAERCRSSRVCAGLHSAPVRRSFDKEIGATRVVVVMDSPCRGMGERPRSLEIRRFHRGSGPRSFCENQLEKAQKFTHLHARDDERRKQAQLEVMRPVHILVATQG